MRRTHTRTHVEITFANPYLQCAKCRKWVTGWHNDDRCGCDTTWWNVPCGCIRAGTVGQCASWGPVDGCTCAEHYGEVPHPVPAVPTTPGVAR